MAKEQDYYLKGSLESLIFLIRRTTDLLNDERADTKLLEEKLTELWDEMDHTKEGICAYIERDLHLYIKEIDGEYAGKNVDVYYLMGVLDSAAFLSRQVIDLINAEAGSKQITGKLEKLYREIDIAADAANDYKYYHVTDHKGNLASILKSARKDVIKALHTMQESDLLAVRERFLDAFEDIEEHSEYYTGEHLSAYRKKYWESQDSEKQLWEDRVITILEDFIELAENAIDSTDSESLEDAAASGDVATGYIHNFLKFESGDMSEIPRLIQLVWKIEVVLDAIYYLLDLEEESYEEDQEEENDAKEPDDSDKLKEVLKAVLRNARIALASMDSSYLDRLRFELLEIDDFIFMFTEIIKGKEDIRTYEIDVDETFLDALEKFGCMIKLHSEVFLKRKFIEAQEAIEDWLTYSGEDYGDLEEDYEDSGEGDGDDE